MLNKIEELKEEALWEIDYYKTEIFKTTLNLETNPEDSWQLVLLKTQKEKLIQAEHRLKRLSEMPESESLSESNGINRFEVIDNKEGRMVVRNDVNVKLAYQDGGKTLKIFLS